MDWRATPRSSSCGRRHCWCHPHLVTRVRTSEGTAGWQERGRGRRQPGRRQAEVTEGEKGAQGDKEGEEEEKEKAKREDMWHGYPKLRL